MGKRPNRSESVPQKSWATWHGKKNEIILAVSVDGGSRLKRSLTSTADASMMSIAGAVCVMMEADKARNSPCRIFTGVERSGMPSDVFLKKHFQRYSIVPQYMATTSTSPRDGTLLQCIDPPPQYLLFRFRSA